MLEVFFYLLFILGIVLTAWGFKSFSPAILVLAGIVIFSVGLMVMVQGIEREINTTITKVATTPNQVWDANVSTVIRTVDNDLSVEIIANILFYGSFVLWIVAIGMIFNENPFFKTIFKKKDE